MHKRMEISLSDKLMPFNLPRAAVISLCNVNVKDSAFLGNVTPNYLIFTHYIYFLTILSIFPKEFPHVCADFLKMPSDVGGDNFIQQRFILPQHMVNIIPEPRWPRSVAVP